MPCTVLAAGDLICYLCRLTWHSLLPFVSGDSHRAWECVGLSGVSPVSGGAWEPRISMDVGTCRRRNSSDGKGFPMGQVHFPTWKDCLV